MLGLSPFVCITQTKFFFIKFVEINEEEMMTKISPFVIVTLIDDLYLEVKNHFVKIIQSAIPSVSRFPPFLSLSGR